MSGSGVSPSNNFQPNNSQPDYPQPVASSQTPAQPMQPQYPQPTSQAEINPMQPAEQSASISTAQYEGPAQPNSQMPPVQPPPAEQQTPVNYMPGKSGAMMKFLILLLVLLVIIGGIAIVLFIIISANKKEETKATVATTSVEDQTPAGSTWDTDIVDVDETWDRYENKTIGFSIKIPKTMMHDAGSCEFKDIGDNSYRTEPAEVPVKVFEDPDNTLIYITSEYFYKLGGESQQGERTYYSTCDKVTNSLAELEDAENWNQFVWKVVIKTINEENELDVFIKDRYGSGCEYEKKVESEVEGVYDVVIGGEIAQDPAEEGPTTCNINYSTVIKYIPSLAKVISWHMGQSCTFWMEGDGEWSSGCYDEDMEKSFDLVK